MVHRRSCTKIPGCSLQLLEAWETSATQPLGEGGTLHPLLVHIFQRGQPGPKLGVRACMPPCQLSLPQSLSPLQDCRAGSCLIALPQRCHLTYDLATTDPRLLALINQVPAELWGAKLALQVRIASLARRPGTPSSAHPPFALPATIMNILSRHTVPQEGVGFQPCSTHRRILAQAATRAIAGYIGYIG